MNKVHNKRGFTIIEVVLVLAIAGLIFLMVFIALPALQRGQRDTQRRDDVSKFTSQLQSYAVNNRNKLPAATPVAVTAFKTSYLKWKVDNSGEFNDPKTGNGYNITTGAGTPTAADEMRYGGPNTECNNEAIQTGGGNRQAAISVVLEGGGVYCQNLVQ
ncbi:type II secretion system protein [Candidatus Saccharibacteria bacterium]|nr:type II secretion system protein [Candidatus Saccharibacteria bacterium]